MKMIDGMASINAEDYQAIQSFVSNTTLNGMKVLRVTKDPKVEAVDEETYTRLAGSEFKNGVIEVRVLSRLLPDAPDFARGFIGIAFRTNAANNRFEGLYIRPTNGRCESQIRRNASTQYFSYPDFKFDRFRREAPGMYESYADIGLNEWIDLRIEVRGERAGLFINNGKQPVLVVQDLKHGPDASGRIGLWVDMGQRAFSATCGLFITDRFHYVKDIRCFPKTGNSI